MQYDCTFFLPHNPVFRPIKNNRLENIALFIAKYCTFLPHTNPLKLKEKKALFCPVCRYCTFPNNTPSPWQKFPKKAPHRRHFHRITAADNRVAFRGIHTPHKPATGGGSPESRKNEISPSERRRARGGVERAAAGGDAGGGASAGV